MLASATAGFYRLTLGPILCRVVALAALLFTTGSFANDHGAIERTEALQPPLVPLNTDHQPELPWVAIIIDDLGNLHTDRRAIMLPGPVACSFLPHTPHSVELAQLARRMDKEVLLHQPMQASNGKKLGPGGLLEEMSEAQFRDTLSRNLSVLPHVTGVNNHMGSLLTSRPLQMEWLMGELSRFQSLFFIDSRTTVETVAQQMANRHQIPSTSRDVFLDNVVAEHQIEAQFELMVNHARKFGSAIAIGHPYGETLAVLERLLPRLTDKGVALKPVGEIINRRHLEMQTAHLTQ